MSLLSRNRWLCRACPWSVALFAMYCLVLTGGCPSSGGGGGGGGDGEGESGELNGEASASTAAGAVGVGVGSAPVGEAVTLEASASDGTPPYGYDWWIEGGPDDPTITDPESVRASVTFTEPGTYNIGLIISDETGAEITRFFVIEVTEGPTDLDRPSDNPLAEVRFWAYQIQRLEDDRAVDMIDELVESRYDLLVLEPTNSDRDNIDFDTADMVRRLHESPGSSPERNKLVVAYIDIGQAEDWRTYWGDEWVAPTADQRGSPDFLITLDPDGWAGNYPVAYWDERWKDIIIYDDDSVLQAVLDDGFDGIYMDWVEAYSDESVMAVAEEEGGLDLAQEMVDFIREIREYARLQNPDFLVIPQNAAEILEFGGQDYLDIIDGIAQEQIYFDGNADTDWDDPDSGDHRVQDVCPQDDDECGYSREFYTTWLDDYLEAGKVVLSVDYAADEANVAEAYESAAANGYIPYVSRRPLDRLTDTPPPGLPE